MSKPQRRLAVHHAPQECGRPFMLFVDLETGKELPDRTVTIDGDYRDSGIEYFDQRKRTGETCKRRICHSIPPEEGTIAFTGYPGKRMATSVCRRCKPDVIGLLTVDVAYEKVIRDSEKRYLSPDKDEFRVSLASQGIGMTGQNVYKRHKTPYKDFIRSVLPKEAVNIIFI